MFEKKRGTRFLASVMALVMLLSLAPVGALAAGGGGYGISVNLNETSRGECNVYYAETKSTYSNKSTDQNLTELNQGESVTHDSSENLTSYGVIFFVAPHDGYAVEGLDATASAGIYQSIVNNENPRQTDFWTKNSQIENLTSAGFTEEQIEALVQAAKDRGCVAAFIFTRSASNRGDIDSELNFTTHQLATFEKSITAVQRGNETYTENLDTVKVRVGDVITYSFKVTFYPDGNNITYSDIVVTDERLGGEGSRITFANSSSAGTQTETKDYTVTSDDIRTGKLENTATLTYNYKAPYNVGAVNSTATATATIATVSAVSYAYTGTVPAGAPNVREGAYSPTPYVENQTVEIAPIPSLEGYQFTGWTAPAGVTVDDAMGTFTMPDKSITFTGEWIANKHSVTYKDGDTPIDSLLQNEVAYGTDVIVESYSKDGHTLTGWEDQDGNLYNVDTTFTMPDKDVTLTAVWEKKEPTKPENPTSEIDAKYFVLTPSITAPVDGSSQGTGNYFPNDSDCGGVEGKETSTGYPGKIKSNLLTDHPTADTQAGYADTTNGIGTDYLVLPGDLGYFSGKNYTNGKYNGYNKDNFPNVLKNLVGEGNQFDMNNYEIVWYVAKKEADGYHVDGYLKGVSIQLKYFDNFNGATTEVRTQELKSGDKVKIESEDIITGADSRTGWIFKGWATNANGDGEVYQPDQEKTLITSTSLYAKWTTTYKVVTHFMDADGTEQKNFERTNENLTGAHGKLLSELVVKPDMTDITGNYVYVPSETKYSINDGNKVPVGNATFTEANTVIHQYYYLDKTGTPGKDNEGKDTDTPNGQPDAWEYKATFIVKNGQWDTNPTGGKDTIVKYLPTKNITTGESIQAKLSNVPTAGNTPDSHYKAGSWDDQKPNEDDVITKDMTYTYTYSWRSSGGSGGSRPTVTIPDDVPTGLNGTDHYAYIIGYGNNDVRPQNNITRAEVATIFFRLLTDETREANMTKSNGYNDVKDGDWFCCAVSTLSKMGIIKGYEDGSFKPNDPISRAEFAAIAARFDPDGDKTPATFADVTSHWAKDEISIAANHGWIKGYEDGSFKPDQKITRAETMTLVNRVLNRLPETKDDLHKDMKTWVDNMDETAWYYLAVQEATNSHYFKNKTSTKFEQWTDLRDTRDWSELEK